MATDPNEIDVHGRGPLLRGWQERAGVEPGLPAWRMKALCAEIVDAARKQENAKLPVAIEGMIRRACEEYCGARLDAARKAFAELKAEVEAIRKELKRARPAPVKA